MQVNNNNLNAMMQMEKKLEQSANALAKLNLNNEEAKQNQQKNLQKETTPNQEVSNEVDITQEIVKQIEIPIAYTANAEVISVQNSISKTLLDIKA